MAPQGSLSLSRPHWSSAFWDERQKCHLRRCECLSSPPTPPHNRRSHRGWATPHMGRRHRGSCRQGPAGRRLSRCRRRSSTWRCWSRCHRCLGWAGRCGRSEGGDWSKSVRRLYKSNDGHLAAAGDISIVSIVLALAGKWLRVVGAEEEKNYQLDST